MTLMRRPAYNTAVIWYVVLTVVGLLLGGVQGWRGMQRTRAPLAGDGALLAWSEPASWPWATDPIGSALVLTHGVALWILLALMLLALTDTPFNGTYGFIASFAILLVSILCGIPLVFPFASRFVGPVRRAITASALVFGQHVLPWEVCSHYRVDWRRLMIVVYSAHNPSVHVFDSQFADPGTLQQAATLLMQHLQDRPARQLGWMQRWGFVLLLLLATVPFVAVGVILSALGVGWAWAYDAVATVVVFVLGGKVFQTALPPREPHDEPEPVERPL